MVTTSGGYSTTDHGDYEEWHVNSGTRLLINIEEGDVFENILFDCSNSGASVLLQTYPSKSNLPSSFTVRNIGYDGSFPTDASRPMTVGSSGSDCVIENVYLGDGQGGYPSDYNYTGGVWAPPEHSGHITFRRMNVQNWGDNGLYCSAPTWSSGGGGGTFHCENSFSKHNQIACFRFGGTSSLENCCGVIQSADHRALWAYDGSAHGGTDLQINNCQFLDTSGSNAIVFDSDGSPEITISNSAWNGTNMSSRINDAGGNSSNPSEYIPEGVPMSALEAATGEGWDEGGGGGTPAPDNPERADYDNVLYVDVSNYDDYVTWEATTTAEPVHADYDNATRDGNDYVTDNGDGTWEVGSEAQSEDDAIFFDGSLSGLTATPEDTGADYYLNGSQRTPDNWTGSDPDDGDGGDGGDGGDEGDFEPPANDDVLGYVRVPYGDSIEILPVFDPAAVEYACWRVETLHGAGAFDIRPRGEASHPGLCVETSAGIWAVHDDGFSDGGDGGDPGEPGDPSSDVPVDYSGITIIDDFESNTSDGTNPGWDEVHNVNVEAQNWAVDGDNVANYASNGNPSYLGAYAGNTDLPAVPGYGQTPVSFWVATTDFQDGEILLEMESEWNETSGTSMDQGFAFGARNEMAQWEFFRIDDGTWTFLDTVQYQPEGDWTRVIWEYDDTGHHDIRLHDETDTYQAGLEYDDDTHQNLGFRVSGAFVESYFDLVHFTDTTLTEPDPDPEPSGPTVIEDFESGGLSNWSASDFAVGSPAYEGSYGARHTLNTGSGSLTSYPGDGLNYYPEQGDGIVFYFQTNRTTDQSFSDSVTHRLVFGLEDSENFYAASFELSNSPNPIFHIGERSNGNWAVYDVTTASHIPAGTWIRGQIDWQSGQIACRYWIDNTDEALGGWSTGTSFSHSATGGGVRINAVALDRQTQLTTDYLHLYDE